MAQVEVRENPAEQRFEILVDDALAGFTVYEPDGGEYALVHTEIDDAYGGQGLGSQLIGAALAELRARGVAVLPYFPFVRAYLTKHPEFVDLVPAARRAEFQLA